LATALDSRLRRRRERILDGLVSYKQKGSSVNPNSTGVKMLLSSSIGGRSTMSLFDLLIGQK